VSEALLLTWLLAADGESAQHDDLKSKVTNQQKKMSDYKKKHEIDVKSLVHPAINQAANTFCLHG
jgi:hypothetical protein